MQQLVAIAAIVKDAQLHHLLERQEDVVEIGVLELLKALLDSSDEQVDVPWYLGVLEGLNGVEESQI